MSTNTVIPLSDSKKRKFLGASSFRWKRAGWFYLFISPWVLGLLAFTILPVLVGMGMSFTNFSGSNFDSYKFIGLSNYIEAFREFFTDGNAWYSLQRTLLYTLFTIPLNIGISLLIASLLSREISGRGLLRTLFYLPVMLPLIASVWVWKSLMDNNFGVLNAVLAKFIPGIHLAFMTDYAFQTLISWSVWAGVGGAIIIFMAGIQGVPSELRDAAAVDGATPLQVFRNITLPLLTPLILYQIVLGFIGGLQVLIAPILLTPAGGSRSITANSVPVHDNYVFMVHVFQESFNNQRFGYGSALLWIMFVFILIVTIIFTSTSKYWVHYEVDPDKGSEE